MNNERNGSRATLFLLLGLLCLIATATMTGCGENPTGPDPVVNDSDDGIDDGDDPEPDPDPVVGVPALGSPLAGTTIDNGCLHTPNSARWSFSWHAVPGADGYRVEISVPQSGVETHDVRGTSLSFDHDPVPNVWAADCQWRVRARDGQTWGDWSPRRTVRLEAVDSDCATEVVLYEHPNFGGDSEVIRVNTPDLDLGTINFADVASSLRIRNLAGVMVYDGHRYTGDRETFTTDISDLRLFGWNDRIGSLILVR